MFKFPEVCCLITSTKHTHKIKEFSDAYLIYNLFIENSTWTIYSQCFYWLVPKMLVPAAIPRLQLINECNLACMLADISFASTRKQKRTIKACVNTSLVGNQSFSTEWSHRFWVLGEYFVSFCAAHSVNQTGIFSILISINTPSTCCFDKPTKQYMNPSWSKCYHDAIIHWSEEPCVHICSGIYHRGVLPQSALKVQKSWTRCQMSLSPALERQQQMNHCRFKVILVYTECSRSAKTTSISKTKRKTENNRRVQIIRELTKYQIPKFWPLTFFLTHA